MVKGVGVGPLHCLYQLAQNLYVPFGAAVGQETLSAGGLQLLLGLQFPLQFLSSRPPDGDGPGVPKSIPVPLGSTTRRLRSLVPSHASRMASAPEPGLIVVVVVLVVPPPPPTPASLAGT